MGKNKINIDKDLLFDGFFEMYSPKTCDIQKKIEHMQESPKQMMELLELCYFMIRTAFMSERRLSSAERKKYLMPFAYLWASRILIENKRDTLNWVSIINGEFKEHFKNTQALEIMSQLKLDIQYTNIPLLRIENSGRLVMGVALMPFLMQINCSYLFFNEIDDKEKCEFEIRQKILPLLVFQNDPLSIPISNLPVIYGLDNSKLLLAKQLSFFQIYFMILHEMGHLSWKHVPGQQPAIKINSAQGTKEIEADIFAYSVLENFDVNLQIELMGSIVSLLNFFALTEELKNKMRNRNSSTSLEVFCDRIHLAKIAMRGVVSKYGSDEINKTSYDDVEEAANKYIGYALYPLGHVQNTIYEMTVEELHDFSNNFTHEGIIKYFEENKDAEDSN